MNEKLDLDGLKQALINSAMGLTFRECHALIDYAQSLEADNLELCGVAQAADAERRALESRVELGSMLLREQIDKTCAANLRLLEIESRASNAGGAVAEVESYTNGSYHRNYKLKWLRDVEPGAKLYLHPAPASKEPVADERRMFDAEELLHDAWWFIRLYAEENPKFMNAGRLQDPCGAHRWLQRYDEFFPEPAKPEGV